MLNFKSMMSWLLYLQEHVVHTLNFESIMSCFAIISSQTELAVAQGKFVKKTMKPDKGEWLGEYICCLILGAEISKRGV